MRQIPFFEASKIMFGWISARLKAQVGPISLLCLSLALFQVIILDLPISLALQILLGLGITIIGLSTFIEGINLGLMPLGESTGVLLPRKSPSVFIIIIVASLGFLATLAEPGLAILRAIGEQLRGQENWLVTYIVTKQPVAMLAAIGTSIGISIILGVSRFMFGLKLKSILLTLLSIAILLSILTLFIPGGNALLGIAWDCGSIALGPVTVPLILSLGLGVSRGFGKIDAGFGGLGLIAIASLLPAIGIMTLGFITSANLPPFPDPTTRVIGTENLDLVASFSAAAQAVLPLVLLLIVVHRIFLRTKIKRFDEVFVGIIAACLGLASLNIGISLGLNPLSAQLGKNLATTVKPLEIKELGQSIPHVDLGQVTTTVDQFGQTHATIPLLLNGQLEQVPFHYERYNLIDKSYDYIPVLGPKFKNTPLLGLSLIVFLGLLLGYLATMAEPTLIAMGKTVEELTIGVRKQKTIVSLVSIGVGVGIGIGFVLTLFQVPLIYFIVATYGLCLILSLVADEETIALAYDGAGVAGGPITIALILSLGIGLSNSLGLNGGFGILGSGAAFPILLLLVEGLWSKRKKAL